MELVSYLHSDSLERNMKTKDGTPEKPLSVSEGGESGVRLPAHTDSVLLDWLQEQVVDTIYFDDGRIIDVQGHSVRVALDIARHAQADPLEPEE
jgi:hypothetical protein